MTSTTLNRNLASALVIGILFGASILVGDKLGAGTIAIDPNQLVAGATSYDLRDYENLYDSAGNVVTNRLAQPGDSIQGVFVITQVSNSLDDPPYFYSPASGGGAVEITGVFDQYVAGINSMGNYILTPNNTTVVGARAMSGTAFQSLYGANAMIAVFSNTSNAMPIGSNGNGLNNITQTAAAAFALATTGTEWASFGSINTSGGTTGWGASDGYFWAANQHSIGVATFAASLGMIQNNTAFPTSMFAPVSQNAPAPPLGPVDTNVNGTGTLANVFAIQGTTNLKGQGGINWMGSQTIYGIGSTDPAQIDVVPEPSTFVLVGAILGGLALWRPLSRKVRR
jgi:hypothetical protein